MWYCPSLSLYNLFNLPFYNDNIKPYYWTDISLHQYGELQNPYGLLQGSPIIIFFSY